MKTKITLLVLISMLGLSTVFANVKPNSENIVENEMMTTNDNSIIISAGKRIYTLNMNTYEATLLATSPYVSEINSIASDNTTGWIFYVSNQISSYNWTIYGYNVYTNTHKNFGSVRHYFTSTGHAYSSRGLASGGATFYNGKLYFAMEYPVNCYYYRDSERTTRNSNPKDELNDNVRAAGTTSYSMFSNGTSSRNENNTENNPDDELNAGRDGSGETLEDFEVLDAEEANEINDNVNDYIAEEELPEGETTSNDDNLAQRNTSTAETYSYNYYNSTYNNKMYLLEISIANLSDASGNTTAVTNGTPVYDPWGYSSFLYKGELGDIVVDDQGQLYAATSYQVQAYNFNTNRYDWANNEDIYAQMAKDKNSKLQLLKNRKYYHTYYYYGCPQNVYVAKSFVQSYTAPSNLRTYNNINLGAMNEITGLDPADVGRITDASDYIRLTPPVSYKVKGYVFDDNNENGNYNSADGETKISGVTVTLYADNNADGMLDSGDTAIETKNTNSSGNYTFDNVTTAQTLVKVTVPTDDANFTYTLTTADVVAVDGSNTTEVTGVKFGINKEEVINTNYNISGTVFDDNNENGAPDSGEAGLENITVSLYDDANANGSVDAGETVIATATTDANGSYSFTGVSTENTVTQVTVPANDANFTYTLTTAGEQNTSSTTADVTGVDFGINKVQVINYSISGNVYDDDNEDGGQDAGEAMLENITVTLYNDANANGTVDSGEAVIASTTSAANGSYSFTGVTTQNTVTQVTVPSDNGTFTYTLTTAGEQNTSSTTADVTGINFGINEAQVINYSISGNVYDDDNEDGGQDAGEAMLENITVTLYNDANANGSVDSGESVIASTTSAANGSYSFTGVTTQNTVTQVTVPSDNGTFTYTLTTAGEQNTSSTTADVTGVNFGINEAQVINYSISGNVYDDDNEDGGQDAGEAMLENITVTLYDDANANGTVDSGEAVIASTTSAANGSYSFTGVTTQNTVTQVTVPSDNGTFTYTLTTAGEQNTSSTTADVTGVNFGINENEIIDYKISGLTFNDDDGDGTYDDGTEDDDDDDNPSGSAPETRRANVVVRLYEDTDANGSLDNNDNLMMTTASGATGTYEFRNVGVKNTLVKFEKPADNAATTYTSTTPEVVSLLNRTSDVTDVNYGVQTNTVIGYNISGTVFDDDNTNGTAEAGEAGLDNVTVTLFNDANANGTVDAGEISISSTTTDANGSYSFTGVTTQNTVTQVTVPADDANFTYTLTTAGEQNTSSTTADVTGVNFGINQVQVVNYNVSGTVFDDDNTNGTADAGEIGLEDITVTIYEDVNDDGMVDRDDIEIATTLTDRDGNYSFANITAQNTLVQVTVPSNTASFTYTLTTSGTIDSSSVNTDVTGINFGINQQAATYSISGTVFDDDNQNGVNEERGLANITVRLYEDTDQDGRIGRTEPLITSVITDRDGNYTFAGLTSQYVIVQVVVPASTSQFQYVATTPVTVPVNTGVNTTNVDFGIDRQTVISYDIRGTVWDDDNANQVIDLLEVRLPNVNVTLYRDANANGVIDAGEPAINTIATSLTGTYAFNNVNFPNAIVKVTVPQNGTLTTPGERVVSGVNTPVTGVNFGININVVTYEISGVVFDDDNRNGIADPGEGSVDGLDVEVYIDSDGNGSLDVNIDQVVAFTQTTNDGFNFTNPNYVVGGLPQGLVFVRIVIPAGQPPLLTYTPTYDPDTGTVNPDGVYPTTIIGSLFGINFGIDLVDFLGTSRNDSGDVGMFDENGNSISAAGEPVDVSSRLRLYPNPTVKEIAINAEEFSGDVTVEIYNDRGYKVMTTTASPENYELKVNVQRLAPGMYYAKFASRNKVASKKFVKK